MLDVSLIRSELLAWYDRHARSLAWRAPPGAEARTDPYRVWLSEVMLQQTTTPHATPYFQSFTARWPTVSDLAGAEDGEVMAAWAGLGYYARARNLLACARAVAGEHGGVFPDTEAGLLALPGVGAYTAAAVAAKKSSSPRDWGAGASPRDSKPRAPAGGTMLKCSDEVVPLTKVQAQVVKEMGLKDATKTTGATVKTALSSPRAMALAKDIIKADAE